MNYALSKTRLIHGARPKRETLRRLVKITAGSPARLTVSSWGIFSALYFLGPLTYNYPPSMYTWGFIAMCIFTFVLGDRLAQIRSSRAVPAASALQPRPISNRRINRIARTCALLGLMGAVSIAVDKLFLSGLDYSQGIAAVRYERLRQVWLGEERSPRSPLLYLGFIVAYFSIISYLLYLLKAEAFSRSSIWLTHLALASPVVLALLYSAQGPVVMVLALAAGAVIVRILSNQTPLPKEPTGRRLLAVLVLLSVLYNGYIITGRMQHGGVEDYPAYIEYLEINRQVKASALAEELVESGYVSDALFMSLLTNHFYFTHGFSILDRVLQYDGELGPYYGQYQTPVLTILIKTIAPILSFDQKISRQTQLADIAGVYTTAWGAMYLDFGLVGAIVIIFACGWLSGYVYRHALFGRDLRAQLLMCFIVTAIIISPVQSIFAISVSLPIFCSILICNRLLRPGKSKGSQTKVIQK